MNTKIVQIIEFKKSVSVIYEGQVMWKAIKVTKVYVLRSGKPSFVIDETGDKYDFEYISDKDLIYRTIVRNLMFKELV
jgi:hypothetical protein